MGGPRSPAWRRGSWKGLFYLKEGKKCTFYYSKKCARIEQWGKRDFSVYRNSITYKELKLHIHTKASALFDG
ncbi:MAG: hypothetical protein AMJ89_03270 [candidate division Zixibacteria bacterium SM23_73]|nr:MAG: hypothetical protein AMJ89_03270 [candidate division Zixibacteria bacterium SM23_73]